MIKKEAKKQVKFQKKTKIWAYLRISFWSMLGLLVIWILATAQVIPMQNPIGRILGLAWFAAVIASFVLSLIHLRRHKEKTLAIVALALSSLVIIMQIVYLFVK
jgi:hypothetical protein